MANPIKNHSAIIERAVVLDGLRSLYLTQSRFDRFLKEDSYSFGYREGFEDALNAMAQMLGVTAEFEATQRQVNKSNQRSLPGS